LKALRRTLLKLKSFTNKRVTTDQTNSIFIGGYQKYNIKSGEISPLFIFTANLQI